MLPKHGDIPGVLKPQVVLVQVGDLQLGGSRQVSHGKWTSDDTLYLMTSPEKGNKEDWWKVSAGIYDTNIP